MAVKKSELYSMLWEACNKLRGGVEPARYKDYVLLLLFHKYVSDRYKGEPYPMFQVTEETSFDALIAARGKSNVGELVDKIISKFMEDNQLQGSLPDVSFNNTDELGTGKELVDKVSGLIAVFQNPAIDFRTNRASGDDIIGDAYEYFMMKFAQESGKSKGQFYTPSEVSRVIARLIGIGNIKPAPDKSWTLYDPACGSGSLLIRAADEAPVNEDGNSIVSVYGQEKDTSTAGLAKMNLILHQKGEGEIAKGNTLMNPKFTDHFNQLMQFDFIVMNPPFSDKSWSDGIKTDKDTYHRFEGFGIPPAKNGDWAWFLHVIKSLEDNGKAGIVMPHGVLFRGNAEETIRRAVLDTHYIKGVVSLPANLFYGTGIPACLIFIDKENADDREGVFFIDASTGYKKDGNKNRLREQDIEKIVRVYNSQAEIDGYSRLVPYSEIIDDNGGNMNVPRYIRKIDNSLPQNITAHLNGGIPAHDIRALDKLWAVSPDLKAAIFTQDSKTGMFTLRISPEDIENIFENDKKIQQQKNTEGIKIFDKWSSGIKEPLLSITEDTSPKELIRSLGSLVLEEYTDSHFIDRYDVFDCLMNYWNEKLQDDIYAIMAYGYEAGRETEKGSKKDTFDGVLIPREVIEKEYFSTELAVISELSEKQESFSSGMEEMREEESGDEGLLREVLSDKGDISKKSLTARIKEIESRRSSDAVTALTTILEYMNNSDLSRAEKAAKAAPIVEEYDIRARNGSINKKKTAAALKTAHENSEIPDIYTDEYKALTDYRDRLNEYDTAGKAVKTARKELDEKVIAKYDMLTTNEIKHLLFDRKWLPKLSADINGEIERILNDYISRVIMIAKRYEHTLGEIEDKTAQSRDEVRKALERMGYKW